jgi:Zn finger protein HypA/HybF involved in hydrogenase expression
MTNIRITIIIILLIMSMLLIKALAAYRQETIISRPLIHVNFEHADHKATQCVMCHHDYLDNSGSGTCYSCHKLDLEIAHDIEDMFHTLCRDCHIETRMKGETAGPVRQCKSCHLQPDFVVEVTK